MDIEQRLSELKLVLPQAPRPIAAYVPAVRAGHFLFVSGQLPLREGTMVAAGAVGASAGAGVAVEQAQQAARQCVLNALAVVKGELGGDWSRLVRIVRLGVFVQCVDGFAEQAKVANGASELLVELLGEAGKHARAAVGVNALPLNAAVEVELMAEVRD